MVMIVDSEKKCEPYIIGEKIFNQYVLKKYLGQGGFGRVFLVENRAGLFALKVVQSNVSMDIRGMETIRNIDSIRLVKFLDYGKTIHNENCFVMEYVQNTLADILQRQSVLDVETACNYFEGIVGSLIELEGFNIIHRDIKPSNLFIVKDVSGNIIAKIGDFGTAKFFKRDTVSKSEVMGTPHYMSPEHFKSAGGHSMDRWSAAVIFYQMLTGKFLFDGDHPSEIIGAIMMRRPELSKVQKNFIPFFKKCFAKDIAHRHQTAREMLQHFQLCRKKQIDRDSPTRVLNREEILAQASSSFKKKFGSGMGSFGRTNKSDSFESKRFGGDSLEVTESIHSERVSATNFRKITSKFIIAVVCVLIFGVVLGATIKYAFFSGRDTSPDLLVDASALNKNMPEKLSIRSKPVITSDVNFEKLLDLTKDKRPKNFVQNVFIDNPDKTLTDERSGLVWKVIELNEPVSKQSAQLLTEALNTKGIVAHPDWRLPTVNELFTLMSSKILDDQSYLKITMDTAKRKFWSADYTESGLFWFVDYSYGIADNNFADSQYYVLAVRLKE